ncbi:hypothetical protein J3A64_004375 [Pseudarthrobacter sp. PvP004]|uniref:hypothetical protein n=1 Tax=Pseudarthrobacter sp. PvP004 TaxID=2817850 RepID=UPI001AEAC625|nr:hypothetical protein [Pseudarthrobacter sp. PvP004]MBP2268911.1 hypothetical protein [Pseudarthrobacter sp. PvP004]
MEESTVVKMMDPDALPVRRYKAWEYFLPGDEVVVTVSDEGTQIGVVADVMPDGSGLWVYLDGIGRRLFDAADDVIITRYSSPA